LPKAISNEATADPQEEGASKRGARPTRPSRQHPRNPANAVRTLVARVSAAFADLR